jgi:methylated-DNA-[protein]-cysteine S-methyltransferase
MGNAPAPVACVTETALGWAGVALGPRGIQRATLFHRSQGACDSELRACGAVQGTHVLAGEALERLRRYAAGSGSELDEFPVDLVSGTPLQRATWLALRRVPFGETRSYSWLAREVGVPGKQRAIGMINGQNPIPLWLPCHRIIAANGDLQGYAGGLAMKQTLLELEGALPKRMLA